MRGDVLRAMMRTAPFTPMHARSDEERTKLAVGAAVLTIVVVGGALFFMKGNRNVSVFESLKVAFMDTDGVAARIAVLKEQIEVLRNQADQGALDKKRASALQVDLVEVQEELARQKADLKQKILVISNHAAELEHQKRLVATAESSTATAESGKVASEKAGEFLSATIFERNARISNLQEELSTRASAGADASAMGNENNRLVVENASLKAEAAVSADERTAAVAAKSETDSELREAKGNLQVAKEGQLRLQAEIDALTGIRARLDAAEDANTQANIKIKTLTETNKELNAQGANLAIAEMELRKAVESNKILTRQADVLSEKNAELIFDLEQARARVRELNGIANTVETLRSVAKKLGDASDSSISAAADSKLDASEQKLRADMLKQSNDALAAALAEVGGVIHGQDHALLLQLQQHYRMMNGFVALYDQFIEEAVGIRKELAVEKADHAGAIKSAAWKQQELDSMSVRVSNSEARLLESEARTDSAVNKEKRENEKHAAELKTASEKLLSAAVAETQRVRDALVDQKASCDKTVAVLQDGIKELEKLSASQKQSYADERVAHALIRGKVSELEQELARVKAINDTTSNNIFDLSHNAGVASQKILAIEDANSGLTQETLSAQREAEIRFASLVEAFSAIVQALGNFTRDASTYVAHKQVVSQAPTETFFAALDGAISAMNLGVDASFPSLARNVFSESLGFAVQAANSSTSALLENTKWTLAYDKEVERASQAAGVAAAEVARLSGLIANAHEAARVASIRHKTKQEKTKLQVQAELAAAIRDAELARAELAAAVDLAEKAKVLDVAAKDEAAAQALLLVGHGRSLCDIIMRVSTPALIIEQLPTDLKVGSTEAGKGAEKPTPESEKVALVEKARSGLAKLPLDALIKILVAANNHRVGFLQRSLALALGGACAAAGVQLSEMPTALTESGLEALRIWVDKMVAAILVSLRAQKLPVARVPTVAAAAETIETQEPEVVATGGNKRRRGKVEAAEGQPSDATATMDSSTDGDEGMRFGVAFGVVADANRRVTQVDFLGAFLCVQRMVLMTAILQGRLRTIEATAGMTSAITPVRFGRRMRRAYV